MTITEDLLRDLIDTAEGSIEEQRIMRGVFMSRHPRKREAHQLHFDDQVEPSKTQQSFKDECNINNIMAKFRKSGEMAHLNTREPTYGDFSTGLDYQAAQNRVLAAQGDFDSLSAEIRARMHNNPAELLTFVADPENLEEARSLGLIAPAELPPADLPPTGAAASEGETPSPLPSPIAGGE